MRRTSERIPWLSRRQADVLSELLHGATNKEIARALGVSPATVAYHLRQLFVLAGVDTRAGLVAWAFQHGDRLRPGWITSIDELDRSGTSK